MLVISLYLQGIQHFITYVQLTGKLGNICNNKNLGTFRKLNELTIQYKQINK